MKLRKKDLLKEFMDKVFGKALLSLPGKIITLVVTAALLGVNLYGTTILEQSFDHVRFLPPDSMSYRYSVTNSKYFPVDGAPATVYTGNYDYFENQGKLHQLYGKVIDNQYVVPSSVSSWYEDYITWAKTNKPAGHFDQGKITNKTLFFSWLKQFLQGPGIIYGKDVRMTNDSTGSHLWITAARMHLRHKDLDSTQTEVKAMEDLREKIKEVVSDEDMAFAYSSFYLGWETNKIIYVELIHNMIYTMITMLLVTLVFLANLRTCLTVVTCVGFTIVNTTGTMYFWGLSVDIVTAIILVLAVGLSVDYATHIGHSFMHQPGKRHDRAHYTIRDSGPAVWNGGFSSFLAVVLLASSSSYVFKTFFKVFFCVVIYGLFHGLCYLPVLLSFIGPAPDDSAQSNEDKTNRLSSAHPSGSPGEDDVICEKAMTRNKKTPVRNGKQSAQNYTQNVKYPMQPQALQECSQNETVFTCSGVTSQRVDIVHTNISTRQVLQTTTTDVGVGVSTSYAEVNLGFRIY